MFMTDYVSNGQGFGSVGGHLANCRFDVGLMRPYIDDNGRRVVVVNTGRRDSDGKPIYKKELVSVLTNRGMVINGPTSLRKLEWIEFDTVVVRAARERLRAWSDLAGANSFGGFNGMSKLILEHETMSDPGEANVDFDGLTEGRTDSPKFQLQGLPLPITHSDFWFSQRRLAVSRNTGTPLDTTMAEAAGRRVGEMIEKTLIGTQAGLTYGNNADYGRLPTVYGYTNFPDRITKNDMTVPDGTNGSVTVSEVLQLIQLAADKNYFGPFMLYHSTDWDQFLDDDYILTGGNVTTSTLRNRIRQIDQIQDVRRLDFLKAATNPFTFILVQMTSDVARAVSGLDVTTVQWESMGGMRLNFKVMAIQVPQLRADFNGNTGIVHATTA